jgi:hypothetical protein
MKTTEKPTMKLIVWSKICLRSARAGVRTDAPAILARYTGTSGKIQGDKKDRIPAARAVKKVMLDIYVSSLFSIATMPQTKKDKAFATTQYLIQ